MKALWLKALVVAAASAGLSTIAHAAVVVIAGSMEGNLAVSPGDTVKAGFDFKMPGNHPATTVTVSGSVTIVATCPNGSTSNFVITVAGMNTDPLNDRSDWFPSSSRSSPVVYQGNTAAPDACAGQSYHIPNGATFMANVTTTANAQSYPINIRFHYADTQDNDAGGWSEAARVQSQVKSPSN